jgi:hypothetical protein
MHCDRIDNVAVSSVRHKQMRTQCCFTIVGERRSAAITKRVGVVVDDNGAQHKEQAEQQYAADAEHDEDDADDEAGVDAARLADAELLAVLVAGGRLIGVEERRVDVVVGEKRDAVTVARAGRRQALEQRARVEDWRRIAAPVARSLVPLFGARLTSSVQLEMQHATMRR